MSSSKSSTSVASSDSGGASPGPALEVSGLRVAYGKAVVLDGVDLHVDPQETLTVVGPNGAGKTSLLRALSRLIPSEGEVLLQGEPVPGKPTQVVEAGLIHTPEGRRLFPGLTVQENLRLGAHRLGRKADTAKDMQQVIELFPRLGERLKQVAGTMSGGEQQQLAIGRSLMGRPKVLLLDEPTMGLSVGIKEVIAQSVAALKERGITMLLVEQDVGFAFRVADRAMVLEHGKVAYEGTVDEVANDPRVREAYLGVA
jgi:branched-chain amino acid transport system ATP-binding protein